MMKFCYVKVKYPSGNATYIGENAFALARHIEYKVNANKVDHQAILAVTESSRLRKLTKQ